MCCVLLHPQITIMYVLGAPLTTLSPSAFKVDVVYWTEAPTTSQEITTKVARGREDRAVVVGIGCSAIGRGYPLFVGEGGGGGAGAGPPTDVSRPAAAHSAPYGDILAYFIPLP
jgi:hypothetical protein